MSLFHPQNNREQYSDGKMQGKGIYDSLQHLCSMKEKAKFFKILLREIITAQMRSRRCWWLRWYCTLTQVGCGPVRKVIFELLLCLNTTDKQFQGQQSFDHFKDRLVAIKKNLEWAIPVFYCRCYLCTQQSWCLSLVRHEYLPEAFQEAKSL